MKPIRFLIAAAFCLSLAACKKDPLEGVSTYCPNRIAFHEYRSSSATNLSGTIQLEWDGEQRLVGETISASYDVAPENKIQSTITYTYDPDRKSIVRKRVYKTYASDIETVTYARMTLDKDGYVIKIENVDADGHLRPTLGSEQIISDGHVQTMYIAGCSDDLVWKRVETFSEVYAWNKSGDLESVQETGKNPFSEERPLYTSTFTYDTSKDNTFAFDALVERPSFADGLYQCRSLRTRHLCTGKTRGDEVRKYTYEMADGKVTKLTIGFLGGAENGYRTEYTFTY